MKVEKQKVTKNHYQYENILKYAQLTNNLYNHASFIVRQNYFNNKTSEGYAKYLNNFDTWKIIKKMEEENYKQLPGQTTQSVLKNLNENWKSYFSAIKEYKKNPSKFKGFPKHPGYKKKTVDGGLNIVTLPSPGVCHVKDDGLIHIAPKFFGKDPKFTIKPYLMPETAKLKQVRFRPKDNYFVVEIIYDEQTDTTLPEDFESKRIASIDIGLDNLLTVTNNVGTQPIIISGRMLKSKNKYFNHKIAEAKSKLDNCQNKKGTVSKQKRVGTSKEIKRLWQKRENIMQTEFHKASRIVIDYCKEHDIDTLVIGHNKGQKQESNLKNFVQVPVFSIIKKLEYKCADAGIKLIETEESYTSGTSFLDGELPVKENYDRSRRTKRGLFVSNNGVKINSDINGSLQIMRKVFPDAEMPSDNGFVLNPFRINL